ncbi:MAG: methionyl-tRNA formyltransferase, partial [Nitrospirae bacterium CG_4_10_14_3_um_filter_53_41]
EVVSTSPFKVAAGRGALQVQRAQREGDEEMDGEAFAKKYGIAPGAVLKE